MPHGHTVDREAGLARIVITGDCSLPDLVEVIRAVAADADFELTFDILTDARRCQFTLGPDDILALGETYGEIFAGTTGRSAIVVRTPRETALALLHQRCAGRVRPIQLFSKREAAMAWLRKGR